MFKLIKPVALSPFPVALQEEIQKVVAETPGLMEQLEEAAAKRRVPDHQVIQESLCSRLQATFFSPTSFCILPHPTPGLSSVLVFTQSRPAVNFLF